MGGLKLTSVTRMKKSARAPRHSHQVYQHTDNENLRREGEEGAEIILEKIMTKNFQILMKEMNLYIQEVQCWGANHSVS